MNIYILPRWNPSVDEYFTQSQHSWAPVEDSVEMSWATLPIKNQGISGGHPPEVKQDRCDHSSWTCSLNPKKVLKVMEDICWI